jgi:hypothetical protein
VQTSYRIAASLMVAAMLCARTVHAQPSPPYRAEVWGGICAAGGAPAGRLVSTYSPPLLPAGEFSSHGGQTLTLDRQRGIAVEGGVNFFRSRHVGVQVLASRRVADLGGANGPYAFDLTYVSRQPPDSTPETFTVRQSIAWPDTSGAVAVFTAAMNGVVRVTRGRRANATVSAGLTYNRVSGTANQLGYTTFRMGGHAVLFSDEYHVAVSLGATSVVGFDVGGEIDIPVNRRAALLLGYRYFGAPATDVSVRVASILNADQVVNQETPATIAQQLAPAPVRLKISESRMLIGVKFAL